MNNQFIKNNINEIANEFNNIGNYEEDTFQDLSAKYNYSSQDDLRDDLCLYFMQEMTNNYIVKNKYMDKDEKKMKIKKIQEMPQDIKQEIYNSYIYKKVSISKLMKLHSLDRIEFENIIIEHIAYNYKSVINTIIDELSKKNVSLQNLTERYFIPKSYLVKVISIDKEGKKVLDEYYNYKKAKQQIPLSEIVEAFLSNNLEEMKQKYNVSDSFFRNRLRRAYGSNYVEILRKDNEEDYKKMSKTVIELFQYNGYTVNLIHKTTNYPLCKIKKIIDDYYKNFNKERPKIVTYSSFINSLNSGKTLDEVLKEAEEANRLIPQKYIDNYLNKDEENKIDITSIKKIVGQELYKLQQENYNPNFVQPYKFLNHIKSKDYNTTYQVVAVLYKLIKDNNLPRQNVENILENIDNEEITNSLNILTNTDLPEDEFLQNIKNDEFAKIIYLEEKSFEKLEMQEENNNSKVPSLDEL